MMDKVTENQLKERAAEELVRLFSAEASAEEVDRIKQWRTDDEAYQQEFLTTAHVLGGLDALVNDEDILALVDDGMPEEKSRRVRHKWPLLAMAATVLLVVGVGLVTLFEPVTPDNTLRYVTRIGEQKTVELPDGSVLTLNTGTRLLVSLSDDSRKVVLERGEAYFDVAKDPQRPFTVDLGVRTVSVLGTEFNIHRLPERFTLAVIEGVVSIHKQEEQASSTAQLLEVPESGVVQFHAVEQRRLSAGMVAEFNVEKEQVSAYAAADMSQFHSWRTGLIRFDEEPLYKVVQQLNRYSGKKIIIEDSSVMDIKIYATVRLDAIDKTLRGLEHSLPIKVINHFDKVVIVGEDGK